MKMTPELFKPTAKVSLPDFRDYIARLPPLPEEPLVVDLMPDVHNVEDQQSFNACTANALIAALEIWFKRRGNPVDLSRMYAYFWIRLLSGLQDTDQGAYPRDICAAAKRFGICLESTYPYLATNLYQVPTRAAIIEGVQNANWEYAKLDILGVSYTNRNTLIRSYLSRGIPILCTMMVHDSFFNVSGPWREQTWDFQSSEHNQYRGNHEVLLIGYDNTPHIKCYLAMNSWGPNWGNGGFFGISYNPAESPMWSLQIIQELWAIYPKDLVL